MSRKSVVKDICGIFENEPHPRSSTKSSRTEVEDAKKISSRIKRGSYGSSKKSPTLKSPPRRGNNSNPQRNPKYATIKDRINKFNLDSTHSKSPTSSNIPPLHVNNPISPTIKQRQSEIFCPSTVQYENLKRNLAKNEQNEATGDKSPSPKSNSINKVENKTFPEIPSKPKYLNKIKPHPDMLPRTKEKLKEKIKIFNDLSGSGEMSSDQRPSQKTHPKPPPVEKEELYDVVVNSNQSKPDQNLVQRNAILRTSPKPPENLYDTIQIPKNLKQIQMKQAKMKFRTLSKDHSLENDGFVKILEQKQDDDSGNSSDEELATEYDVIENVNVTKITVERRYKMSQDVKADSTFNVTRETYYDQNLNPRIERISRQVQKRQDGDGECRRICKKKSSFIIQELLESELAYFTSLLKVYEDYIVFFKESNSPDISHNLDKVFGNFEEIYQHQLHFYGQLTDCRDDVDKIADVFLKNVDLFNLYEKYILNMHISNKYATGECLTTIKARDHQLGNKLNLESYLLTPFQRLIRYRLLLKNLQEALQSENDQNSKLDSAITYLDNFIEGTNIHAKIAQGIQNCPFELSSKGKLLMTRDYFVRTNGKKYLSTVILFDDVIVFTKKVDCDSYVYKNSINLSDLYIRSIDEETTTFQLQNFTQFKLKHESKYVFDLEVSDAKVKQEWVKKIESLLWNQFEACRK